MVMEIAMAMAMVNKRDRSSNKMLKYSVENLF